ncbi:MULTISPECIES: MmcQ/YjbR family DNA-binding protein [Cohnella]|uniref:MmcQ/YjbR family DNA-binding protein n=1 Tax=Cohnella TaxID=329857 RepID=UPI0009BA88D1|nr:MULTISPECIES: MmcQ/YjbR family DNA-binding protein [Cohnella]MBN2981047.1 MmcQ/YjbR family DNA-binding protein [Cohnella algarum]
MKAADSPAQTWIAYCLNKKGAALVYPFGADIPVVSVGGKMFASFKDSFMNVKCDPHKAAELREQYAEVTPGYYMNKRHWNSIDLTGRLTKEEVAAWIDHSYELIFQSLKKDVREAIRSL